MEYIQRLKKQIDKFDPIFCSDKIYMINFFNVCLMGCPTPVAVQSHAIKVISSMVLSIIPSLNTYFFYKNDREMESLEQNNTLCKRKQNDIPIESNPILPIIDMVIYC